MKRTLVGRQPTFRPNKHRTNFYRVLLLIGLILLGLWLGLNLQRGEVKSPFVPSPTPTRMAESFFLEAKAYFDAGKLDDPSNDDPASSLPPVNDAIDAYKAALQADPQNAQAWAELARIQAYSSSTLQ